MPKQNSYGEYIFNDRPDFRPNVSPKEMFEMGSFGGTYWRPIYSNITKKHYKNLHHNYPTSWWRNVPEDHLTRQWKDYDKNINKYKVKVGTTLEFWEDNGWITKYDPYGWVMWYCGFFMGNRGPDDERQIARWLNTAGPNSRFRKWLVKLILRQKKAYNDYSVSPAIRQTLLHWAATSNIISL
jgi:hypothetical protein